LRQFIEKNDKSGNSVTSTSTYHYLMDVFSHQASKYFIYEADKNGEPSVFYKQAFTIEGGVASLIDEPVEVERKFVAASKKENNINTNKEEKEMKEKVDKLIVNGVFAEDQRETLMGMDETVIDSIITANAKTVDLQKENKELKANAEKVPEKKEEKVPEKKEEKVPILNEKKEEEPMTEEEYIANAPGDLGILMKEGLNMRNAKKENLIEKLTANKECPFTKEHLQTKDIPELEGMVTLAGFNVPTDFSGRGGNLHVQKQNNERQEDGSGVPDSPGFEALCDSK
jgi:hypothetical protein